MHCIFLTTLSKHRAKTSKQARREVTRWLSQNINHHCLPGITDWFVIGGRWSGMLSPRNLDSKRNRYKKYGYEDDALIVTGSLYDKNLKCFEKKLRNDNTFNAYYCDSFTREGSYADLDNELLSRDFVGLKWLVLVACHS